MSDRAGFQYWREPLFVVAAVLYLANSLWWKPMSVEPESFVRCYFGDVLSTQRLKWPSYNHRHMHWLVVWPWHCGLRLGAAL